MANRLEEVLSKAPKFVKISLLEYEEKLVPVPLFVMSVGLMTGFTFMFPILGLITAPAALVLIASILSGDVSIVQPSSEEE